MVTKSTKRGLKKSQKRAKVGRQQILTPFGKGIDLGNLPAPLDKLNLRLTSPRLRSERTRQSYLESGLKFLNFKGDDSEATPDDFRRYFLWRRENNISERTLGKEFYSLRKLAQANGWEWTFEKEDVPVSYEPPKQVVILPEVVEQLIRAHPLYTKAEKFYLAVSTTWGCRREDMVRILPKDIQGGVIRLPIAKNHPPKKHRIPDVLLPLFTSYRPKIHDVSALSYLFQRICKKAGYKRKHRESFHGIRNILDSALNAVAFTNKVDPAIVPDYMGWTKAKRGRAVTGSDIAGHYDHRDIILKDEFYYDTLIYPIHPFLSLWEGVTGDDPEA